MEDKKQFDAELARKARAKYMREYRAKNKEKVKAINEKVWARKFEKDLLESGANNEYN